MAMSQLPELYMEPMVTTIVEHLQGKHPLKIEPIPFNEPWERIDQIAQS